MKERFEILYVSTVPSFINSFLIRLISSVNDRLINISILTSSIHLLNPQVIFGENKVFEVPLKRSPLSTSNISALSQMKRIIKQHRFHLVHTQTPIASALIRLANSNQIPLIYSAHGFHFHSKSNLLNWILFFPIEFLLSFKTDILVTTNKEDFKLAKKFFHPKRLELIYGVGVDFGRFIYQEKSKQYLQQLGISESSKVLVSVGELNKNKNYSVVIQLLAERPELAKVHYVICGEGNYRNDLVQQIHKLGLSNRVHLLGHRQDIPMILAAADLFVFPSKREGFGMALLEAILSDLDFVAFRIRGIVDLVPEKIHSSHLVEAYNKRLMGDMIVDKITHPQPFSHKEHLQWLKQFLMEEVNQKYLNLYESLLTGKDPSHS